MKIGLSCISCSRHQYLNAKNNLKIFYYQDQPDFLLFSLWNYWNSCVYPKHKYLNSETKLRKSCITNLLSESKQYLRLLTSNVLKLHNKNNALAQFCCFDNLIFQSSIYHCKSGADWIRTTFVTIQTSQIELWLLSTLFAMPVKSAIQFISNN